MRIENSSGVRIRGFLLRFELLFSVVSDQVEVSARQALNDEVAVFRRY
jgi:hypothetical protein